MRFSFVEAVASVLGFAVLHSWLWTLACAGALPRTLGGRVEMDFRAEGTEVFASGIIGARLGSLGMAAIELGAALLAERARRIRTEEETYAAASH